MARATITIHLPSHRRKSLKLQEPHPDAAEAYDANIGAYIRYLQDEAQRAGFTVDTDQRDLDQVYSIDEDDHESKKAAHDWLHSLPDIWNWIP